VLRLFHPATRRRFGLAVAGSVSIAFAEVIAVLAVLPLMQLIADADDDSGAVRWLRDLFGDPSQTALVAIVSGIVLAGFVIKGIVSMAIRWWTLGFLNKQGVNTASELLRYYLLAPVSLYSRRGAADLLRTMGDAVAQVYTQIIGGGMAALTEAITITAIAITLLVVSPLPTLAVALYFGAAGVILQRFVKHRSRRAGERFLHAAYVSTQTALQALGGIKEIKLRNEQDLFVKRYAEARDSAGQAMRVTSFLSEVPKYTMEMVFILGIGLMTVLVYARESSDATLATLALFAVAGYRVMPSTVRLLASIAVVRAGGSALDLVERDVTAARALRSPATEARGILPFERSVVFENVSFSYEPNSPNVLSDISMRIPAGSSVALVGPSGAGKSTFVDLLLGLQSPSEGRIVVDGVDTATNIAGWQKQLAMVPQDVYLLDGTLRENIRFSPNADDPDDRRLHEVVELAQLADLLAELPEGLDTHVGERGTRLSGGQRQRVGIARALFLNPRLLVLDEATSALDNETERRITDTIDSLHGHITVVVVAHRLSTVRRADQLLFLRDGRLDDIGTFDELRVTNPRFAHLVELGNLAPTPER